MRESCSRCEITTLKHQRQEQVVVQRHRGELEAANADFFAQVQPKETQGINLVHALGAVGDVDRMVQVVQEHPDDFTKPSVTMAR